ncbi:MAG TPA: autotransporter outer membrane beta-barrel domain-containing protein, partial [Stenotrophomonas sp.]
RAGRNRIDVQALGVYWTTYTDNGAYVDGVLQGSGYDAKATSDYGTRMTTDGLGFAASLEAGRAFELGNGWALEPQAQVMYQVIDFDDGSDPAAAVRFRDVDSLAARLGARARHSGSLGGGLPVSAWLHANLWHEFRADAVTELSSEAGFIPFHSDQQGSWYEVGAGISAQLTPTLSLYGSIGYQKAFSHGIDALDGNLGLRWNW